ncbi:MAG: hypothetical protein KVP17_000047 [Porospora cf. gigantea B]|uniref:uncharacterized protein n=1 Tax=Porospora cf. gigantea B TaxID=2853592 RepID=UPI003571E346|nr:MAG: hypothetical protein KVP17_000047 [Porospora cf. gigantea B]
MSSLGAASGSPSASRFFSSTRQEPRKFSWSFLVQAVLASSAVLHVSRVRRQINGTWSDALKRTHRNLEAKNEIFYERMVRLADRLLKTESGPLLPDHDQLKYPPGLPTLVFDPEKVLMQRVYDVRASLRTDAASDWMEDEQTTRG